MSCSDALVQKVENADKADIQKPCYLPQQDKSEAIQELDNLGPWATGRVDWSPLAGLTGTRPVVDKYTITRFSENEWRQHNKDILDATLNLQDKSHANDFNTRQSIQKISTDIDNTQHNNTNLLRQREQEIHRYKCELEHEIEAMTEEIVLIQQERQRLKAATRVLLLPESIVGECLERRTSRLDTELVRDDVEEELIRELSLIAELKQLYTKTLKDIEKQLVENQTVKQRLEFDWSDKKIVHEIEIITSSLNNTSNIMMFKPGAVVLPADQSTPEDWLTFTRESLELAQTTRKYSSDLRSTLDGILMNGSRDLRQQADRVELALAKRIACCEELTKRLEIELKKVLQDLVDTENLIDTLRLTLQNIDKPMKKAQTRLDMRLDRPRVENCRDAPTYSLIDEVKTIKNNIAQLLAEMKQAQMVQNDLITVRNDLEREIMLKLKTLEIDKTRIQRIRAHYPSATALSGH